MPEALTEYRLHVGGEWCDAAGGRTFESLDPSTGEPWARVQDGAAEDVDRAVAAATRAFAGEWKELGGFGRARAMHGLADLLEEEAPRLAEIESRDNGKLLRETRGQAEALPGWLRYFAGLADEAEAVRMANDSAFGLAAGVWTENVQRAHRVADALRVGTVWVNGYRVVAPNVPFGGFGASGWGRENGVDAVREYTATKSVWIEIAGAARDPFQLG